MADALTETTPSDRGRACTDADTRPKPPWRARKEAYLAHLEEEGPDALLVSAADKLHAAWACRRSPPG